MSELIIQLLKLFVFISPIYIANTTPVIAAKTKFMEFLNRPIDFNLKFMGKPLFGSHKTIRGYVVGVTLGTFFAVFINYFTGFWQLKTALLYGFLVSLGSLIGDTVKSFFKRRVNIKPGKDWIPFDQLDYSIGALAVSSIVVIWAWWEYLFMIGISIVLHIGANILKKIIWKK